MSRSAGWSLLVALGGCPNSDGDAAARERLVADGMVELESRTAAIRDAVMRGNLPDARSRAGYLATALPPMPDGSEAAAEQLKLALSDVAGAADAAAAAAGVGRLAQVCGDCHQRSGVGTAGRPPWRQPPTRVPEMARHAATIDQLWLAAIRGVDAEVAAAVGSLEAAAAAPGASAIDRKLVDLGRKVRDAGPAGRAGAYGELLTLCANCHGANRPRALPQIDGLVLPDLQATMDAHFVHGLELQLSVMGGDLEAAHRAAQGLADAPLPPNTPAPAVTYVEAMRAAATAGATAPDLAAAAQAMGQIALACAGCHTASGGGPKETLPAPPSSDAHMAMHLYGAYWLGYGVYAPNDRAWLEGATALGQGKLAVEGVPPTPEAEALDAAVHALAVKAAATPAGAERAAVWAEVLSACAPCHTKLPR